MAMVIFAADIFSTSNIEKEIKMSDNKLEVATFGTGCFWCTETLFEKLKGVESAVSGYSGGTTENPTYKQVCTGETGHAEVIQVTYDPSIISFTELLEVFWKVHDPTTLNRQGNDVGTQYRSAVFYHNEHQQKEAEEIINELNAVKAYDNPIVTQVEKFEAFYKAKSSHQNYYNENKGESYCRFVIQPKVEKFEKVFKDRLKK